MGMAGQFWAFCETKSQHSLPINLFHSHYTLRLALSLLYMLLLLLADARRLGGWGGQAAPVPQQAGPLQEI